MPSSLSRVLVLLVWTVVVVEGKRPRRKKSSNAYDATFSSFLKVIKYTILFTLAPVFIYFIYTIVTDPDLPRIAKHLYHTMKRKWVSYLRKNKATPGTTTVDSEGYEYESEGDEQMPVSDILFRGMRSRKYAAAAAAAMYDEPDDAHTKKVR